VYTEGYRNRQEAAAPPGQRNRLCLYPDACFNRPPGIVIEDDVCGLKNGFYFRFAVTTSSYEMRGLSGSAGSSANAVSVDGAAPMSIKSGPITCRYVETIMKRWCLRLFHPRSALRRYILVQRQVDPHLTHRMTLIAWASA
jgi:hypothetical protein